MARDEALPWDRQSTYYSGGTIDPTNLGGVNYEGQEFRVQDTVRGSGEYVTLRVVRNSGTKNLFPQQVVSFDANYFGLRCNQPTITDGQFGYPVDELLPSAGVVPNDLFYIVTSGPALCLSPYYSGVTVVVGTDLVAITATGGATTAADAGHVQLLSLVGAASTNTETEIINRLGKAVSALTNGQTNTSVLVHVKW